MIVDKQNKFICVATLDDKTRMWLCKVYCMLPRSRVTSYQPLFLCSPRSSAVRSVAPQTRGRQIQHGPSCLMFSRLWHLCVSIKILTCFFFFFPPTPTYVEKPSVHCLAKFGISRSSYHEIKWVWVLYLFKVCRFNHFGSEICWYKIPSDIWKPSGMSFWVLSSEPVMFISPPSLHL